MNLAIRNLYGLARWNEQKHSFIFDSGSTLVFKHLSDKKAILDYQGGQYQYIGIDEVTDCQLSEYQFLFSRLRRDIASKVPARVRSASNPVGPGVAWVRKRFVDPRTNEGRIFIPSLLDDNIYIDKDDYELSLKELDPVLYRQLRLGEWDARPGIRKYKREWFKHGTIDNLPYHSDIVWVRYWDLASTSKERAEIVAWTPSYTAGVLMGFGNNGLFYIRDVIRDRLGPKDVQDLVLETAKTDPDGTQIFIEQEGGSSEIIIQFFKDLLSNFYVEGDKATKDKETRDKGFSSAVQGGKVVLIDGPWTEDFLDELEAIPEAEEKDQRDAAAGAYNKLKLLYAEDTEEDQEDPDSAKMAYIGGKRGERANSLW